MDIRERLSNWLVPIKEPTSEEKEELVRRSRLDRRAYEQRLRSQRLVLEMVSDIWNSEKRKERWDLPTAEEIRAAANNEGKRQALKERYADIELWRDDWEWVRLGAAFNGLDLPTGMRTKFVTRSRQYFIAHYPLFTRTVLLYTWYCFGKGVDIGIHTAGEERVKDAEGQAMVTAFMNHKSNKSLFSTQGFNDQSVRWLLDGELFPTLFLGEDEPWVVVRGTDCLQITEIQYLDDDDQIPLWYKREWSQGKERKVKWYADWKAEDTDLNKNKPQTKKGEEVADLNKIRMAQWKFIGLGERGLGLGFASLEWLHEHKRLMERRITIGIAAAMVAWVTKYEGTHAQGDALLDSWGEETSDELRIPPVAGTRLVENEKATTSWMKTDTNAQGAKIDDEMFVRYIAAGLGITPILLGYDVARWATAQEMTNPTIVSFMNYQQRWEANIRELLEYVFVRAGLDPGNYVMDIDFPPIKVDDKKATMDSLLVGQQIVGAYPDLSLEIIRQTLMTLGVNNVDELMKALGDVEPQTPEEEEEVGELLASLKKHRNLLENRLFGGE